MSGSRRASFISAACWRRSKPLFNQAEKEGRECVLLSFILKAARQQVDHLSFLDRSRSFLFSRFGLTPVLLPAQQFPVNIGDLLQLFLDPMVVRNPAPDLFQVI